jgi:hypothetical protein
MQHKSPLLKSLIVGLVVAPLAGAIVAVESFSGQTGPGIVEAQQQTIATPTPIAPGTLVAGDAAIIQALALWVRRVGTIPPAATTGGRDTELSDCHSAKVNFTVTHGWCYASAPRLFYNVTQRTFKDPRTGQLFTFDATKRSLLAAGRADDVQLNLEPPTLPERHTAQNPAAVSMRCTPAQLQDITQHVQNLGLNAARSDSPIMQALFQEQALWWQKLCM